MATLAVAKAKSAPDFRRGAVETPAVQSVERALSLLEAVAGLADPVPLARLTEILGIDPSSVFRLANTLKRRGFLANPNGRKHYVLGPAVWRLSREYDWSRMLISSCRESVKALATRTGETAHLAVREGREVFFIDHHASGEQGVIVPGQTGKLMPLHCTAHGKSLLADFGLAELKALYGSTRLERYTARTRVSLPELAKACAQVRADGCSIDEGSTWRMSAASPRRSAIGRPGDRLYRCLRARHPYVQGAETPCSAQHVCDTAEHINGCSAHKS